MFSCLHAVHSLTHLLQISFNSPLNAYYCPTRLYIVTPVVTVVTVENFSVSHFPSNICLRLLRVCSTFPRLTPIPTLLLQVFRYGTIEVFPSVASWNGMFLVGVNLKADTSWACQCTYNIQLMAQNFSKIEQLCHRKQKPLMTSGHGSHWPIASPVIIHPCVSLICQFLF